METLNDTVAAPQAYALECLTIADCGPLYERIKQGLALGESIVLNLSDCEEVDTAGLQFLVAIQNDPEVNLKVHWTKPSDTVSQKAARLGLTSWIHAGALEV